MTTGTRFITIALAGLALTTWGPAWAADPKATGSADKAAERRTESSARRDDAGKDAVRPHPGGLVQTKWLIGAQVHDTDGKDLGKVAEIWLDPKTGQAKEVIVSVGSTLGVGGKNKVISWNEMQIAWKDQKLFLTADPRALRDAYQTKMDREDRGPAASPATAPSRR